MSSKPVQGQDPTSTPFCSPRGHLRKVVVTAIALVAIAAVTTGLLTLFVPSLSILRPIGTWGGIGLTGAGAALLLATAIPYFACRKAAPTPRPPQPAPTLPPSTNSSTSKPPSKPTLPSKPTPAPQPPAPMLPPVSASSTPSNPPSKPTPAPPPLAAPLSSTHPTTSSSVSNPKPPPPQLLAPTSSSAKPTPPLPASSSSTSPSKPTPPPQPPAPTSSSAKPTPPLPSSSSSSAPSAAASTPAAPAAPTPAVPSPTQTDEQLLQTKLSNFPEDQGLRSIIFQRLALIEKRGKEQKVVINHDPRREPQRDLTLAQLRSLNTDQLDSLIFNNSKMRRLHLLTITPLQFASVINWASFHEEDKSRLEYLVRSVPMSSITLEGIRPDIVMLFSQKQFEDPKFPWSQLTEDQCTSLKDALNSEKHPLSQMFANANKFKAVIPKLPLPFLQLLITHKTLSNFVWANMLDSQIVSLMPPRKFEYRQTKDIHETLSRFPVFTLRCVIPQLPDTQISLLDLLQFSHEDFPWNALSKSQVQTLFAQDKIVFRSDPRHQGPYVNAWFLFVSLQLQDVLAIVHHLDPSALSHLNSKVFSSPELWDALSVPQIQRLLENPQNAILGQIPDAALENAKLKPHLTQDLLARRLEQINRSLEK